MAQKKKKLSERENAEIRHRALIDKRNELNDEANQVRSERNTLNDEKKRIMDEMKNVKLERNEKSKEMKGHRNKRNAYQKKAKELIEFKKKQLSNVYKNLPQEIEEFTSDLKFLETKHETTAMTIEKENELLDKIRAKQREIPKLRLLLDKQEGIQKSIDDVNAKINELFKQADEEHELVVKHSKLHQQLHDKYMEMFHEATHLTGEANKKHQLFIAIKERANLFHEKAQEMREKVFAMKKEMFDERKAARQQVKDQNKVVRGELLDSKKLENAADDAVKKLLSQGKIEL